MICFHHHDRPAIGICKSCARGLCADCAADLGHGLACKGLHETEVTFLDAMVRGNATTLRHNDRHLAAMPMVRWLVLGFFGSFGLLFLYFGWRDQRAFGLALGGVFLVFAIAGHLVHRRIWGTTPDD